MGQVGRNWTRLRSLLKSEAAGVKRVGSVPIGDSCLVPAVVRARVSFCRSALGSWPQVCR